MTPETEDLVRSATRWAAVPFVPEVTLLTAAEPFGLWDRTALDAPPFWAFPWAGGQGLARYVLDHPQTVAGRAVLDVASGSGLVAIAAAKAGARSVLAGDIDEQRPRGDRAERRRQRGHRGPAAPHRPRRRRPRRRQRRQPARHSAPGTVAGDGGPDVVLAADVFYQRDLAALALRFLRAARRAGAEVLAADPGRAFVPRESLTALATYQVPVLTVLEDTPVKEVTVYRLR